MSGGGTVPPAEQTVPRWPPRRPPASRSHVDEALTGRPATVTERSEMTAKWLRHPHQGRLAPGVRHRL